MEQIQLLRTNQIDNIWYIIQRDYVTEAVKSALDIIKKSENFTNISEKMKLSTPYLDELARIELVHQNNLTARQLLLELKELGGGIYYDEPAYGHHWVEDASIEVINNVYADALKNMDSFLITLTLDELKVNSSYAVIDQIEQDIKTRLSLTTISDLDTIVKDMISYIDITKYVYNK